MGVVFALFISALSIKNLLPMDPHLLFDLTFLIPPLAGAMAYAVFKTMREGTCTTSTAATTSSVRRSKVASTPLLTRWETTPAAATSSYPNASTSR